MLPEPVTVTLIRPSARQIRETKLDLWRDWEAANNMPGDVRVHRSYDVLRDCPIATITVRSAIPATMKWNEQ